MQFEWTLHHRPHRRENLYTIAPWQLWQTCMRQIAFLGPYEPIRSWQPGDEIYRGVEAYQFLLEVITGLRSSLKGETEIFGQFKIFIEAWESASQEGSQFNPEFLNQLLLDAKKIRTEALSHLGSQSYGSLARKWLAGMNEIHLVGAGQLTQEILPWIVKTKVKVSVHARDVDRARAQLKDFAQRVEFYHFLAHPVSSGGLILCAPVRADEIQKWMSDTRNYRVLDLRGESEVDPLHLNGPVLSLKQAIQQMESNKKLIERKVQLAQTMIRECAKNWLEKQKIRPFGWDDLCA